MPYKFTPDKPYFVFDSEAMGFEFFATEEERDKHAATLIPGYLNECWSEDVENIIAGKITHSTQKTNIVKTPDDLDEDGCSEDGTYWDSDYSEHCDYELLPVGEPEAQLKFEIPRQAE